MFLGVFRWLWNVVKLHATFNVVMTRLERYVSRLRSCAQPFIRYRPNYYILGYTGETLQKEKLCKIARGT